MTHYSERYFVGIEPTRLARMISRWRQRTDNSIDANISFTALDLIFSVRTRILQRLLSISEMSPSASKTSHSEKAQQRGKIARLCMLWMRDAYVQHSQLACYNDRRYQAALALISDAKDALQACHQWASVVDELPLLAIESNILWYGGQCTVAKRMLKRGAFALRRYMDSTMLLRERATILEDEMDAEQEDRRQTKDKMMTQVSMPVCEIRLGMALRQIGSWSASLRDEPPSAIASYLQEAVSLSSDAFAGTAHLALAKYLDGQYQHMVDLDSRKAFSMFKQQIKHEKDLLESKNKYASCFSLSLLLVLLVLLLLLLLLSFFCMYTSCV